MKHPRTVHRFLCLGLAGLLLCGCLAACGKEPPSESRIDSQLVSEEESVVPDPTSTPVPHVSSESPANSQSSPGTTKKADRTTDTTAVRPTTTTTTAAVPEPVHTPTPATAKDALSNTLYKLTVEKKLTVGYLGGSVTYGTGASNESATSWRALTTQWLKNTYPYAAVTEANAAIGGTGSLHGACRLQNDLLKPSNPDLIFVEFAINDGYQGYLQDQSERYMESLIRMAREYNAKADIVLVYVTTEGQKKQNTDAIYAFNTVATRYHIPVIDVGKELYSRVQNADSCFKDGVHPNDSGHAYYAAYVQEFLKEYMTGGKSLQAHTIPKASRSDLLMNPTYYSAASISQANPDIGVLRGDALEIAVGETVHVAFKGKTLVMCWQTTHRGTVYTQLDSESRHRLINGNPNGTQRILFEDLSSGSHNLAIQAKGTDPMFIQRVYAFQ